MHHDGKEEYLKELLLKFRCFEGVEFDTEVGSLPLVFEDRDLIRLVQFPNVVVRS